jgi:glycerol-3-phosphate dehydrogenase (NAD(P)+)
MTLRIGTLGSGSWGTALSILLARNGHPVTLWGRNANEITQMQKECCNTRYLPGITLPELITPTTDLQATVQNNDVLLLAVPSHAMRSLVQKIKPWVKQDQIIVWATKGLEPSTNKLLHVVIEEELGQIANALLTGPSFAKEVAQGLPTTVVIAARNARVGERVINLFANNTFRPYYTDDVIGAEIGGTVKNVMAIAAGAVDALQLGANSRAALITRGLHELTQLGVALGARSETFVGLSGLGDLVLTCTDNLSRNRRFGLALGRGLNKEAALAEIGQVVEGVDNVQQVLALAHAHHVSMPITEHIQKVLDGKLTAKEAVMSLFTRELKAEHD